MVVEVEVEVEVVTAVERAGGAISVPLLQLEHLLLDSVNERVEVVDLGHELRHLHLLVLDRGHRLVGLGAQRVARVESVAALEVLLRERLVLGDALVAQDLDLVLQDLELLLHLRQRLMGSE